MLARGSEGGQASALRRWKSPVSWRPLIQLAALMLAAACSDQSVTGPHVELKRLRAAPETLTLAGQSLILRCSLWRDFMPVSPPNGRPLIVVIAVETADSTALPVGLDADAVYVLYDNLVWKGDLEEKPDATLPPYRLEKMARNGPKWGPDVYVDVVVRLVYEGRTYLLRASQQRIQKIS